MEKGGRIHPSGRRADHHPYCYSLLNTYTIADNDSQQDGNIDTYSYADKDANSFKDSICYSIVFCPNWRWSSRASVLLAYIETKHR